MASRKDDIRKWLEEHNIPYNQKDIKKICAVIGSIPTLIKTLVPDEAAEQQGHLVKFCNRPCFAKMKVTRKVNTNRL